MAVTINLTAGETWPDGSKVTLAKLRATGKPSASLEGQFGTNEIADNAVTAAKIKTEPIMYGVDGSAVDATTVTISPVPAALANGLRVVWKSGSAKTSAATLNLNGLGAKALRRANGAPLVSGDIALNQIVETVYNSSLESGSGAWVLLTQSGVPQGLQATTGGSANAYTLTLDAAPAAYYAGYRVGAKVHTANTAASTVNVNSLGAKSVKKYANVDVAAGDLKQDQLVELIYDGTNFQMVTPVGGGIPAQTGLAGLYRNLLVQTTSVSAVQVTADELALKDAGGGQVVLAGVSITGTISGSGANGLDTGAEAAGTWYYVWAIYNGTTVSALFSTSATSPTLPSGYTYKAMLGAVRNDASSNFITFVQRNDEVGLTQAIDGSNNASTPTINPATASGVVKFTHPLGYTPQSFRVVAWRSGGTNDPSSNGWATGTELNLTCLVRSSDAVQMLSSTADATYVYLIWGDGPTLEVRNALGSRVSMSASGWQYKAYFKWTR